MDGSDVRPRILEAAKQNKMSYQVVAGIQNTRKQYGNIQVLVEWEGLPDLYEQTWEPAVKIAEDVPEVFEEFLSTTGEARLKSNARLVLKENNRSHK